MLMEMFGHLYAAGLIVVLVFAVQVYAQDDQSGFISLDCGLPKDSNYTEKTTGIDYISDAAFIDTGVGKKVLPEFKQGMPQQLWYVRSFPDGIRNCYKFNLTKGSKYLIRASFMYGNYDEQDQTPAFDLHIGSNKWESVTVQRASLDIMKEIIHVLPSSYLQVCLVNTGSGAPFISALEIRPLKSNIYRTQSGSLSTFVRLDVASTTNVAVRYKEDIYDRVWIPYQSYDMAVLSTSLSVDSENSNAYVPPSAVMNTAGTPKSAGDSLSFTIDANDTTDEFYVYMHFAEIQELLANEFRQFNISLNGDHWYGPFSPNYLQTSTLFSPSALTGGKYSFLIYSTERSTLPPILNAIEVYTVKELLQSQTDDKDVDAITNIKSTYGVKKNWQGDPCAPQDFMWEGLNCSYDSSNPPRITSLNLSSSGLKGDITSYLSSLTLLGKLDLSNNNLIGSVPDFLSQLPLTVLNLEGNKLTGSIPAGLLERSKNGSLLLSVGANLGLCSSISCKQKKTIVVPVVASVAAWVVIGAALFVILWILKRRRQQAGKVQSEVPNNNIESFQPKNRQFKSKDQQFSYSEVLKMTKNFERILGKGGFGTVYHGYLDEMEVAIKMLSASTVHGFQQFQAEVQLLMRVHHRNLVTLIGYCEEGEEMALIYEYMANGNLQEQLSDTRINVISWEGRIRIAVEAAQGLEYLHHGCKPPIIHRDVKSTNILLNEKFQAKLADFGLSKSIPNEGSTHVSTVVAGTPGYLDPQYYGTNQLSEKSDVYSFGVVILEIITCRQAITNINENEKAHISKWVGSLLAKGDVKSIVDPRLQGDFDTNSVWKAVELAMACLSPTANRRPTMNVVVMELNECLAMEMARTQLGSGFVLTGSINHMISMNFGTDLNPRAR